MRWSQTAKRLVWVAANNLLAVARYVDERQPNPRMQDDHPENLAWMYLRPILGPCHNLVVHYTGRDGTYAAASDTMEFGDVTGFINEIRHQVLKPIGEALATMADQPEPTNEEAAALASLFLRPLQREYLATARTLDEIDVEVKADSARRHGLPPPNPRTD